MLAAAVLASMPGLALADAPLVQDGKHSVYQRVVSHPSAKIYAQASTTSQVVSSPRTFTSLYVFERQADMMRVGVSASKSDGWIRNTDTTEWPQAITMVFTDQMGRQPVLFFKSHEELEKACLADSIKDYVGQFTTKLAKGESLPEGSPVIAAEPMGKEGQISEQNFYLLPVLNIGTQFQESGTQLIEVACIDPGTSEAAAAAPAQKSAPDAANKPQMTTAIAFVIDTTISMGPYIEQTTKMVREIFDELQKSPAKNDLAIAVVAFRSNVDERPKTEYTTKIVSDFKRVTDRQELESLLAQVKEATASTHAFDEDSFAGVKDAVDKLSWDKFSTRAMLLLSDAGPLREGDPLSKTGMSAEGMADYLRTNNIYLTAIHIKTPSGKKDHAYAEKEYQTLSKMSNGRSSYIPIDAPTVKQGTSQFEAVGRQMSSIYRQILESNARGELAPKPETKDLPKNASPVEQARRIAQATGYAMQLQFLGTAQRTSAPSVQKAWIADADLAALETNPGAAPLPAVYPAVLLTKSQLSQLRQQLGTVVRTAEEAFLQDNENFNFFEQLVSAAAQMSRDPTAFSKDPNANLAQKGVLLEVLDGLPYRSRILGMRQDDWVNMSTGEQQEFIKRLKGLIKRYEEYDRDNAHWESFGSQNPNEWVYRVPLNMLP